MGKSTVRIREKINDKWLFSKGDIKSAKNKDYDDKKWKKIELPHDWSVYEPYKRENFKQRQFVAQHLELQNDAYLPKDIAWYRKKLPLDKSFQGKRIYIEFEGVFRNATLWINGKKIGTHLWGYTGHYYDITDYVEIGKKANVLALRVDAREMEGWWYDGAGIYRHVWLIAAEPVHIKPWGCFVTTPQVSASQASVKVKNTLVNTGDVPVTVTCETTVLDHKNKAVARDTQTIRVQANNTRDYLHKLIVKRPRLWSVEEPNLYQAKTVVKLDSKKIDEYQTTFGIRSFKFTANKGFFLNGKRIFLKGMNIHHDFGGLGTALPDRANEKTVELMKEMGCNVVRAAHNQASPALMEACDRLGILFLAETRYLVNDQEDEIVPPLRELIQRDRNHPCIITWLLANTAGSPDGELTKRLKMLHEVVREEDPTRPSGVGLEGNDDYNKNGFALVTDIVGYNGGGMSGRFIRDHKKYPNRKILITEYGASVGARGVYETTESEYRTKILSGNGKIQYYKGEYWTMYNICFAHELSWQKILQQQKWVAGGLMWAGIEYRGETSGWPCVNGQYGPLDICRLPKDLFYFYQQEWTDKPMVYLMPHWTWEHKPRWHFAHIWCYSNCEEVELFFRGISFGRKKVVPHSHINWDMPFYTGKVVAKGYIKNKVVCEFEMENAGPPEAVLAEPDRSKIKADGEDLSFITISVLDQKGVVNPIADNRINIKVQGPGKLLGICNGDPQCHESWKGKSMPLFNGKLMAIVQSKGQAGEIVVTASGSKLKAAVVKITAK